MLYPFTNKQAITQGFLQEYPLYLQQQLQAQGIADWKYHTGYDFATAIGLPVMSVEDGVADFVDNTNDKDGIGIAIIGKRGRWRYWHLSKILVSQGKTVTEGSVIGYTGNSGISTGSHTHIDLKKDNQWIDWLKLWEAEMSENENLKKWLKEAGDTARSSLKKMGFANASSQPDLEAVKIVSSHCLSLHNKVNDNPYEKRFVEVKALVNKPF